MTTDCVPDSLLERRIGRALVLTLHRPQAMNALDPDLVARLGAALERAGTDRDITAVVIAGAGRAFCAGADLKAARARALGEDGARLAANFVSEVSKLLVRIEALPKPVIAVVEGVAVAGGLELVLACDFVLASEQARFGDVHANYGLLPGGGGSVRLPRKVGPGRAKYLMFTGELLSAVEALHWGLATRVLPAQQLWPEAERLLARIEAKSPLGLRHMKQLVDQGLELGTQQALQLEQQVFAQHARSRDRIEGLSAFAEGRTPVFTGE